MDAERECLKLQRALRQPAGHADEWQPGPARLFLIRDPKPRRITEVAFADRVVHHALCAELAPAFERYAISTSFACRPGKGQQAALIYAQNATRGNSWFFKGDVASYFASIPHDRLLAQVRRRVKDEELCRLLEKIIAAYPIEVGARRGLPIGALTSQHLANLYLGALDHRLKDDLGIRYYLRYMDDFVAFGTRAQMQSCREEIERFLPQELGLQLNRRVSLVRPVRDGVPMLGARIFPRLIRPSRRQWRRFCNKYHALNADFERGSLDEAEAARRLGSQFAYLSQMHTLKRRRNLLARQKERAEGGLGAAQNRREPRQSWGLVGQLGQERARREPQQGRPRQPQPESGFSSCELSTSTGLIGGQRQGAEEYGLRSVLLYPGVDPSCVLRRPWQATRAAKASRPGDGSVGVVAGPFFPDRRDGR